MRGVFFLGAVHELGVALTDLARRLGALREWVCRSERDGYRKRK